MQTFFTLETFYFLSWLLQFYAIHQSIQAFLSLINFQSFKEKRSAAVSSSNFIP